MYHLCLGVPGSLVSHLLQLLGELLPVPLPGLSTARLCTRPQHCGHLDWVTRQPLCTWAPLLQTHIYKDVGQSVAGLWIKSKTLASAFREAFISYIKHILPVATQDRYPFPPRITAWVGYSLLSHWLLCPYIHLVAFVITRCLLFSTFWR